MNPTSEDQKAIKKQLLSFKYAFNGIWQFVRNERHAKIHIPAAIIVIILGLVLSVSSIEWCLLIFAIALVLSMEIINSSIEKLTDKVNPDFDKTAGIIKDLAAGAVLVSALAALFIGLIIFLPKIIYIF